MNLKATKTPLLIAAIACAVTLSTLGPASAKVYWASTSADGPAAEVIEANFKLKAKKYKLHHGYHFHGHKKKKYVSPKSKVFKKKVFKKFF